MGYSRDEMETNVNFDYANNTWTVYSTVPKHIRKIMDITDKVEILEYEGDRPIAIRSILTEKQVSMKKERKFTPEQREKMSKRMKKNLSKID